MAPKPNKNILEEEKAVVFGHSVVFGLEFSIKERKDKPLTMYWLPKTHKTIKGKFIHVLDT